MSEPFSIVIICRNEAESIGSTLDSIRGLSDDTVVYDSGSTDATLSIVSRYDVRLQQGEWRGFGKTRQEAVMQARYNWVLVVDADEVVTPGLAEEIRQLSLGNQPIAYSLELRNHLGKHWLRWGTWGGDFRTRLYPKNQVAWNDMQVHEKLVVPEGFSIQKLQHPVLHYTAKDVAALSAKMNRYALLTAEQYFAGGKRAGWMKRSIAPAFAFCKSYFFKLGFLDGRDGYRVATLTAGYTFLKYKRLHELWKRIENSG